MAGVASGSTTGNARRTCPSWSMRSCWRLSRPSGTSASCAAAIAPAKGASAFATASVCSVWPDSATALTEEPSTQSATTRAPER